MGLRLRDGQAVQVGFRSIRTEIDLRVNHIQGHKLHLRITYLALQRAHLQGRIFGRKTVGPFPVHHIVTQTQSGNCKTIFRFHMGHRVVIVGLRRSAHMRIKMILVEGTHHILDYHGHLLILQRKVDCLKIASRIG